MSNAAPPPWVKALALPSGQWRFLTTAWGWGPFGNASPDAAPLAKPAKVKASIRTIGAKSGQARPTAAKQALAVCAAGWARRNDDDSLTLASWRFPHIFTLEAAIAEGIVVREGDSLVWLEMRACPDCVGASCTRCTGSGLVAVTRSEMQTTPHGSSPTPDA